MSRAVERVRRQAGGRAGPRAIRHPRFTSEINQRRSWEHLTMAGIESRHSLPGESPQPGTLGAARQTAPALPASRLPRKPHASASLLAASTRLTARDYVLATLLADHRVLTTHQIAAILFRSQRTCLNRLVRLRALDFIDRFRPVGAAYGTPWHWLTATLADRYVRLAREERPASARMLRQQQDAIMASPQLGHLVGATQFGVDLIATARTDADARLRRWWSAAAATAAFGRRIRPDAHGVWYHAGREVGWFLEHDAGTEDHPRLVAKLDAYRNLRRDGGPDYPVLFWLPTRRRETHLHHHFAASHTAGVIVATAARDNLGEYGPAGPVWRIAGNGGERYALCELGGSHGSTGPYAPGPPTPEQDPLFRCP